MDRLSIREKIKIVSDKKRLSVIISVGTSILIVLVLAIAVTYGIYRIISPIFAVDYLCKTIKVKVLSIDKNILRGEMIGRSLGSASGSITSDMIIVGVQIRIGSTLFLEDIQLTHSELAYYKDTNTIAMQSMLVLPKAGHSNLKLSLNRRKIKTIKLTPALAKEMYGQFRNKGDTNSKGFNPYSEIEIMVICFVSFAIIGFFVYLGCRNDPAYDSW